MQRRNLKRKSFKEDSTDDESFQATESEYEATQSEEEIEVATEVRSLQETVPVPTPNVVPNEDPSAEEVIEIVESEAEPVRPVQRQRKKKVPAEKIDLYKIHPELKDVWDNLQAEDLIDTSQGTQPPDLLCKLLPFQVKGVEWLRQQESTKYKGGILADEMGMGKTVQVIGLLLTKRVPLTLVICPTVAIYQWEKELSTKTKALKVHKFYGNTRAANKNELQKYDVILTTYAILEQCFRKETIGTKSKGELVKKKSLLHSIEWDRIVLDEAHSIKDRYCSTARASFALKREFVWCLSGTPMQNRIGELFSLIKLLDIFPHAYYFCTRCECNMPNWSFSDKMHCDGCGHTGHQHFNYWNRDILKPIQNHGNNGDGGKAFEKIKLLLDRIMIRRTKIDNNDELGLPPRVVETRSDVFNDAEEELYESLYSDTKRTFNMYADNGTILNNYASIFSLLSRMRLAANHPDLVTTKFQKGDAKYVCVICQEEAEDPIMSKCKHVFCREDARQYISSVETCVKCPDCFLDLQIDLTQDTLATGQVEMRSIVSKLDLKNWRSSTKIEALVEELDKLRDDNSTTKSIVFSQFVSFLDLCHWRLQRSGYNVVKLDGRMGPQQRDYIVNKFSNDVTVTVFLVSLKAGGVALNLTEASQVFIMDPWWNPAVEAQAMDRIHRLGQHRPIKITRMIIENSIESRILELQVKKQAMFDSTVGGDSSSLQKLSEEDFRFLFVL